MSVFVYDPNEPWLLAQRYNSEIGDLYKDKGSNAWALLNDERELLLFYLTDVDNEWMDPSTSPCEEHDGFSLIIDRMREVGATNLICLHNHDVDDPPGPCDGLGAFMAMTAQRCDEAGVHFRGGIVSHGGVFEGMVYAQKVANQHADMGLAILEEVRRRAAAGDPTYAELLPLMEEIVMADVAGETPDLELVERALQVTDQRLQELQQPQPRKSSLLDLPQLNVKPIDYLN